LSDSFSVRNKALLQTHLALEEAGDFLFWPFMLLITGEFKTFALMGFGNNPIVLALITLGLENGILDSPNSTYILCFYNTLLRE
jgi:hypothetical protein